jgi:carbamoyltransferase
MQMNILGISAFHHDSAAALIRDGEIVAAAQEERFTRRQHDDSFPANAVRYCLEAARIKGADVDRVAFNDKPFLTFERLILTCLAFAPRGFNSFRKAMPTWISEKLFQKDILRKSLADVDRALGEPSKLLFAEHHFSHAASAFYPSPFDEAAVLTFDGAGEWATTTAAVGRGNALAISKEIHFPHSLGFLYSAVTSYIGFAINSDEDRVMGLASSGEPRWTGTILDELIDVKPDGSFHLNLDYFDYCTGPGMTNSRFDALFGGPAREPEQRLEQRHMDIAASIQAVTEEITLRLTRSLAAETGCKNLCLAGGVARNCVANGKILRDAKFDKIWVQPAAGDVGGALGAALAAWHHEEGAPRHVPNVGDSMRGAYLGPSFNQIDIERRLATAGAKYRALSDEEVIETTARALAGGKMVGWFQGRMELGPRGLGARSILGDPRLPAMQETNEGLRPPALSVLREDVAEWFDLDCDSPYMLLAAPAKETRQRQLTPALSDYPSQIQTVHSGTNPRYHALISRFKSLTGCPVVLNTSFNARGEPIVCTPEDAFRCFVGAEFETLVIGNAVLDRADQNFEGIRGKRAVSRPAAIDSVTIDSLVGEDIWTWLSTFVTINNAFYNGKFAPCPFARAAMLAGRVDVKVYQDGDARAFIREKSIELRDTSTLSTRVMAFPPKVQFQWGISDYVDALNAELIPDNVFLNPGVTKTMKSRYPGSSDNAPYFIVVANRLDAVLSGSEALHRTAYYSDWPREQYQLVVERRERLAARFGAKGDRQ